MLAFKRHSYILEMQKLEIGLVLKCFENRIIRVSGSEYVFLTKKFYLKDIYSLKVMYVVALMFNNNFLLLSENIMIS